MCTLEGATGLGTGGATSVARITESAAAEFFLSAFNMAIRSEEKEGAPRAGFAECVLPPTAGLTIGMLAVTESGGAAGAIDSTRGDEELRIEAEGALTGLNDSCT